MNHSAKKKILIFFLLGVLYIIYIILCPKERDYYIIEDVKLGLFSFHDDNFSTKNYLSIELKKKFISGSKSNRNLFGGSKERGRMGIKKRINLKIYDKYRNSLNTTLISTKPEETVSKNINNSIDYVYRHKLSLKQLIIDINANKEYTRGYAFQNKKIYFFINNDIDPDALSYLFISNGVPITSKIRRIGN